MAWTRIDDKFLMNPKVQAVGVFGMALYVAGLIYSNSNLTDGFIANSMLPMICGMAYQTPARKTAEKLVEANLWEQVEGGYQIHDFLSFNKSKQEIEMLNRKRANNGAKGGRPAKQTETDLLTEKETDLVTKMQTKMVSNQPPIIPNTLNPNTLKEIKQPPPDEREAQIGTIFKTYEHEIGLITPAIADDIISAIDDYPLEWFEDAFEEAAKNNKRNWSYALAILKRWKADGFKVDMRKQVTSSVRQINHKGYSRADANGSNLNGNDLEAFRRLWEEEHKNDHGS